MRPCSRGSSPLARGLQLAELAGGLSEGIIPARAGFTKKVCVELLEAMDHPRSRGVYSTPLVSFDLMMGSSPLARGLLDVARHLTHKVGIIPARAGFTRSLGSARTSRTDHPRSRGVYPLANCGHCWKNGSSPLARGLLVGWFQSYVQPGIIPARAGFTSRWRHQARTGWDHPRSRGVYALLRTIR